MNYFRNIILLLCLLITTISISASSFSTIMKTEQQQNQLPPFDALLPQPQQITLMAQVTGTFPHQLYPTLAEGVISTKITKRVKHREGYILTIANGKATIQARTQAGVLYAKQTLTQLAQDAAERKIAIPACEITDQPSTDYRAIHIDLKHHLDKKEYMYHVLDRMAYYKLNAAIVEYEDKLGYESFPLIAASNAPTLAQWQEWAEYAHQRNIDISPLIQGIGHADFILKHDEMKPLREDPASDWVCCPSNEKYYEVQFGLYADAIRATPHGKYLHVGGDEVSSLGVCPVCKPKQKSALQHQMEWLKRVSDFAVAHERTPIFWDDMVFKHVGLYNVILDTEKPENMDSIWTAQLPELNKHIDLFPKKVVYMRWQYGNANQKGNKMALKWYNDNGLTVMGATAAQTTYAMMPLGNGNVENIKSFQLAHQETPVTGVLCTAWDDASPLFDTFWKGFIAHGHYSWNIATPMKNEELDRRYRIREFGVSASELPDFRQRLEATFPLWEKGLLDKGVRRSMWSTGGKYTLVPPPTEAKGAWSQMYTERIEKARKGCVEHLHLQQLLTEHRSRTTRNDYSLQVFERINDLTGYTAQLLVALSTYDQERDAASLNNLRHCTNKFQTVRTNLEAVYDQTRHLEQPDGYILPMNHHAHLAVRTANTDWMFLFEVDFLKQLEQFIIEQEIK